MRKELIGDAEPLENDRFHELKFKLKEAFRNKEYRLNTREPSETGLSYSDEATEHGLVLNAWSRLPLRQKRVIQLWLSDGLTIREVADRTAYSRSWVSVQIKLAMHTMIGMVWETPEPQPAQGKPGGDKPAQRKAS